MIGQGVRAGLEPHLTTSLESPEGMDPPYFTDKPAWDCYSALLVWAAASIFTFSGADATTIHS
jgi:hypothetical protein